MIEYKERLGEKERELRDLRERHEDNDHKKQRNIDLLENKIQEQRNYYEEMARSLEEENYRRTVRELFGFKCVILGIDGIERT